jgi:hypothetical protein
MPNGFAEGFGSIECVVKFYRHVGRITGSSRRKSSAWRVNAN